MKYELMIIFKPLLPEEIRTGVEKRISTLLKKGKGKILSQDVWGKRHLAYAIDSHEEGYYIVYKLSLEPSYVEELKRELHLINDILRFLITKEEK